MLLQLNMKKLLKQSAKGEPSIFLRSLFWGPYNVLRGDKWSTRSWNEVEVLLVQFHKIRRANQYSLPHWEAQFFLSINYVHVWYSLVSRKPEKDFNVRCKLYANRSCFHQFDYKKISFNKNMCSYAVVNVGQAQAHFTSFKLI